jgi:hypothetical protein
MPKEEFKCWKILVTSWVGYSESGTAMTTVVVSFGSKQEADAAATAVARDGTHKPTGYNQTVTRLY